MDKLVAFNCSDAQSTRNTIEIRLLYTRIVLLCLRTPITQAVQLTLSPGLYPKSRLSQHLGDPSAAKASQNQPQQPARYRLSHSAATQPTNLD